MTNEERLQRWKSRRTFRGYAGALLHCGVQYLGFVVAGATIISGVSCASTPGVKEVAGKACVVIDALEKGCATLKYVDELGVSREIVLTAAELNQIGVSKQKAAPSASASK